MTTSRITRRTADPTPELARNKKFQILAAVLLGLFLAALDQTIVGTPLPRIVSELRGSSLYTWVVTAYLLTSTVTGPIYGKLSDLFGRRPVLMFGISLFLLGSALSGLSGTMWQLILFRSLQGLGAGAIFPVSLAVIGDLFTPAERGRYQGLFGAVFGLASLIGPGLGGFLTDRISWHWVFYVNVPIGIIALFIIWRQLPAFRRADAAKDVDYLGAAALVATLVPMLIALTNKQSGAWTDPGVYGFFFVGLVFLMLFLWVEARAKEPIVPLDLFHNRTFSASVVALFLTSFGFFGAITFLPLWYQSVRGSSATAAGYDLLPFLFGVILSSVVSGQIISRTKRYKLLTFGSLVLTALGLSLFTQLRAETPNLTLWLWMLIAGLGVGPSLSAFTIIVQNAVPFERLGAATSDLTLFRQIGGTVGLTFAFALFQGNLQTILPRQLAATNLPAHVVSHLPASAFGLGQLTNVGGNQAATLLEQIPEQLRSLIEPSLPTLLGALHEAVSLAIAHSFWLSVVGAALAALAVLFIPEVPLKTDSGKRAETTSASSGARGEP